MFVCDVCGQECPDELGQADASPDTCDDCWYKGYTMKLQRSYKQRLSAHLLNAKGCGYDPYASATTMTRTAGNMSYGFGWANVGKRG